MGAFSGIWIPLVTPFSHGAVDLERLHTLVKRYVQAGISGFVALGTTGEPASLTESEQDAVLDTMRQWRNHRVSAYRTRTLHGDVPRRDGRATRRSDLPPLFDDIPELE
jgi:dihydrodipicolinate synthase/N-acetylneuraminate lyase